jgi:DNA-binding CsgD family transcriptional regulator/tetratricopeptide (TPR) repeat protein
VLLERERALADLRAAVHDRRGRLVLVSGEAGAGKSSLVQALLAGDEGEALLGGCDSLRTPRPLAPLLDWARTADPGVVDLVESGSPRGVVFERALGLIDTVRLAVVEDVHWADDATLDLLAFLGRRLAGTSTVLLLTYRSEEAGAGSPLSLLLGDLATVGPLRVSVPALTEKAVADLASGRDVDPAELHRRTGGNAFLVTECLAAAPGELPDGVRHAVLARAGRLPERARAALDALSVVPGEVEPWLGDALGASGDGLDACVRHGLLVVGERGVRFRHELARTAVEQELVPDRRRSLHRKAVQALHLPPDGRPDPARLVHHAAGAADADGVRRWAPEAAAAAEAAGARREAVAHLQLALAHAGPLDAVEQRELWARLAQQLTLVGRSGDALDAFERASELAAASGDRLRQAELTVRRSGSLLNLGRVGEMEGLLDLAAELLEDLPAGPVHVLALTYRCTAHMLRRELSEAEVWGRRALALAEAVGDDAGLTHALLQSGVALWMAGDEQGLDRLRTGIDRARASGDVRLVALGLTQIGSGGGEVHRYAEAVPALQECTAVCDAHELTASGLYARAWLGRCLLELGRWDEASALLAEVVRSPRGEPLSRVVALTALGRLRSRRGDPDAWGPLDEALVLARQTGHLQRLWPVAVARAEAADAEGRLDEEVPLLSEVLALADELAWPWAVGELGSWLWRAGAVEEVPGAAEPYALLVAGRAAQAASWWEQVGRVYDQAEALSLSDDDADQLRALALHEQQGARRAARRVVERRRSAGRTVPRGPNAATRGNPAGLTGRELEVLRLLAEGCTNREVAQQLHLSPKTVGHHVSHVLAKLGARSRAEAVAVAVASGMTGPS